ncbi:tight adherance protein E [Bordetella pertussis]|nr:tight adherance protein E [Bordetella pertussis]
MLAGMLLLAASIATVETMYWHQMRHLAYLALIEAARAGATSHGEPGAIARAFARAMRARHAAGQPGQTAFANHGVANRGLRRPPRIRNDYQAEQHAQRLAQGWPGGAGPRSGLDIFQANTLRLRLVYRLAPLSPWLGALLRASAALAQACARPAWRQGLLPIRLELEMDMQSDPALWPARPDVSYGDARDCDGLTAAASG